MRKVGAHVSASGGLHKAVERAKEIGANCAQIFSGSPRVWKRKSLEEIDTKKMFSKQKELSISPVFTHALYLVNIASDKPELLRKSFDTLKYELEFDSHIKGAGIVVHLGSHQGRGWDAVREQVAQQISLLLQSTPADSTFLIENSAGQNGKLCSDLSEIRWVLDRVAEIDPDSSKRLGWCFDTCHAHAAGYYLGQEPRSITGKSALEEISRFKLFGSLRCIHVNDSRDQFDSGRDRHENIGEGEIPLEDLEYFLNQETLLDIPLILEVPGFDKSGPDAENVKKLLELLEV